MSDLDTSQQETAAVSDAPPIDVDDLPSDAEASTSAAPLKSAGSGRPKGKSTTTASKDKDADGQGLSSYVLPRSTITKIAKSAVPPSTKLQKEVPTALARSAVVFISYLTSLAQEQAEAAGVKTIRADHVLDALPELDWGEADTARLRKDLKKQLKAFRANAKAKKEGKPLPGPSTGRGRGRPPKSTDANAAVVDLDEEEDTNITELQADDLPKVDIRKKGKGSLIGSTETGDEESSDEEDNVNIRRIAGDGDADDDAGESAIEDDIEEEEEEDEEEEDDDDEDIADADEVDPRDFEDEMGQGLDDTHAIGKDQDMDD